MTVDIYKFPNSMIVDDSCKIDFNSREDKNNPFSKMNFKKTYVIDENDDIDKSLSMFLVKHAIAFGDKKISYDSRSKNCNKQYEFCKNWFEHSADCIIKTIDDSRIAVNIVKEFIPIGPDYQNIFLEVKVEKDNIIFILQLQWLFSHKSIKTFGYADAKSICRLACKITEA